MNATVPALVRREYHGKLSLKKKRIGSCEEVESKNSCLLVCVLVCISQFGLVVKVLA